LQPTEGTRNRGLTPASAAYRWYVVVVLGIAYIFSFIDRVIMSLVVEPVRADLQISDTQVSLLLGLAFALFYTIMGIPIARLADTKSRRTIIAAGVTLWCLMTAACGLAKNFWQLFAARMGVGVGEAALSPAANSLISDYFPRHLLGRAIAVYTAGISIGAGLAMMIGGKVVAAVSAGGPIVLPLIGEIKAWQAAFMVVGLPGILVAGLMFTVREPVRRESLSAGRGLPMREALRFLGRNWRTYATYFSGASATTIMAYGYMSWIPTYFIRAHGWAIDDIGLRYGALMAVFGVGGVLLGGWLSDRWYARGIKDAHWRVMLISIGLLLPAYIFVTLVESPWLSLALLAPGMVGGSMPAAAGTAGLMIITPNEVRALASSLYYFVISLVGLTVGPTAMALLTDFYFKDTARVGDSMAVVAAVSWAFAIVVLGFGTRYYRQSVAASESWSEPTSDQDDDIRN
jgi:MFS family permease